MKLLTAGARDNSLFETRNASLALSRSPQMGFYSATLTMTRETLKLFHETCVDELTYQ